MGKKRQMPQKGKIAARPAKKFVDIEEMLERNDSAEAPQRNISQSEHPIHKKMTTDIPNDDYNRTFKPKKMSKESNIKTKKMRNDNRRNQNRMNFQGNNYPTQ